MSGNISVRDYLSEKPGPYDHCGNFYDWFCKDSALPGKKRKLDAKVRKIAQSTKIDQDKMYVWYKNNCPCYGSLYDDIRFADIETGDVIYTIVPKSGYKVSAGKSAVYGRENGFKEPLVEGTWDEVLVFFGLPVKLKKEI